MTNISYKTLEELYSFLESDIQMISSDWDMTRDFNSLKDLLTDEDDKRRVKWEVAAFDFNLNDGKVEPVCSSTGKDGTTVYAYPSAEDFKEGGFDYLLKRAENVQNDHLIVRYNQILWNSTLKHRSNAVKCIDAYLRILNRANCVTNKTVREMSCLEILRNSVHLSIQVKHKIEEHKQLCRSFLFEKGKFRNDLKMYVLELMLKFSQFKEEDFDGTLELLDNIAAHLRTTNNRPDYFFRQKIYETAILIAQKTKSDTRIWNRKIGDVLVRSAESRMEDKSRMIPLGFYQEAISYYKKAGLDKKVKEVEKRYFELKKELKLDKFETPIEGKRAIELQNYFDRKTKQLLKGSPDEILGYLLLGKDLFPSYGWLEVKSEDNHDSFMELFTTMKVDVNNNLGIKDSNSRSTAKAKIYEMYNYYIWIAVLPYLHRIFIGGIKLGKLTYSHTIKFMIEKTWLGQNLSERDSGGDKTIYNWVSLIAPSLLEYFIQTESALRSSYPHANYILAIDSLVLKFEGMFRDFAKLIGLPTTVSGKQNVMREMYIEELLALDEVQNYFDEDDRLLFQYLFTSKDGLNLRNNVAHSFLRYHNYSFHYMHLMICATLRVGKYRIRIQNTNDNENN